MQQYVANIAIAPSTLRNQGAPNVVKRARIFLGTLSLTELKSVKNERHLLTWLQEKTISLMKFLPKKAQNWGTARKAINVFLVQASLNHWLRQAYRLDRVEPFLETPLDSKVVNAMMRYDLTKELPEWEGVRDLKKPNSDQYQKFASRFASKRGLPRFMVDILLWNHDTSPPLTRAELLVGDARIDGKRFRGKAPIIQHIEEKRNSKS